MTAYFDTCWLCGKKANGERVRTGDMVEPFVHICDDCLMIAGNYPYLTYFDKDILAAAGKQAQISSLVWTRANCDRLERLGYLACIDREAPKWMEHLITTYEITPAGRRRLAEEIDSPSNPQ